MMLPSILLHLFTFLNYQILYCEVVTKELLAISQESKAMGINASRVFLASLRSTCSQNMQLKAWNQLEEFPRYNKV
jgi:hypothetical protein